MSVSPTVWAQIRLGRAPTQGLVARVLDGEAVVLGETGALQARIELAAQVFGAGPLEPLLADPLVTDVLVNAGSGVWVDRGDGLTRADCEVGDEPAVRRLAVRLAGIAGRRLDDTSPYVDGLLPGGVRLHAVLPPIAVETTLVTGLKNKANAIVMANAGGLTTRSDFFILTADVPYFDASAKSPGFAPFGEVVEGMDVVKAIFASPRSPTKGDGVMKGQMLDPVVKMVKVSRVKP